MNNVMKKISMGIIIASIALGSSVMAQKVPHFTDNVRINLKDFPEEKLSIIYVSDNDVNISGPTNVDTATGGYPISIHSDNMSEDGSPVMLINTPTGATCEFDFIDGPWTELGYRQGSSPSSCPNLTVSPIYADGQYQYHIDVTYHR